MLPYFAMVDYPCPAYKNPSDYYCEYMDLLLRYQMALVVESG
jgi:hypothetical protein